MNESERTYFSDGDVKVTSARLMFRQKTYALKLITSVEKRKRQPEVVVLYTAIFIVGTVVAVASIGVLLVDIREWPYGALGFVLGAFIGFLGFRSMSRAKVIHSIWICTAASQVQAYESPDEKNVLKIIEAVNRAIAGS